MRRISGGSLVSKGLVWGWIVVVVVVVVGCICGCVVLLGVGEQILRSWIRVRTVSCQSRPVE